MLSLLRYAFLFLLIGNASLAAAQHAPRLRFEVPDERSGAAGWYNSTGAQVALDSLVKQEGKYSLSLSRTVPENFAPIVYSIPGALHGKTIKLRGYLKTEKVTGWAGLWLRVDGGTRSIAFENMVDRPVKGTTDWTAYEIELPYDEDHATSIVFGALIGGTGKIWIDNFSLTLDGIDVDDAKPAIKTLLPADRDTAYYHGSGITTIPLTPDRIGTLTNLGMLWGFIKYYHAAVQTGQYNMDAALFRILPRVLAAANSAAAAEVMEAWVDSFGVPRRCPSCKRVDGFNDVLLPPDYGYLFRKDNLPPSLVSKLEYIRDNRYTTSSLLISPLKHKEPAEDPDIPERYYIGQARYVANPVFRNEYDYAILTYPDAGIRLLALYRYWNMIQYFYPYRHLIGEDWNGVLAAAMPSFCNAADTTAYQVACLKLIARVNDCHAGLWTGATKLPDYKGAFITPFRAQFVAGQLVVTGFYKDTLGVGSKVQRGDVIESMDGVRIKDLIALYLPLTPASNYPTKLRNLVGLRGFLLRGNNRSMVVDITRDGKRLSLALPRVAVSPSLADSALFDPQVGYKVLPGNIGYLYPARLGSASLDSVKALLHRTKALIIDFRCYPATFMTFTYGAWLKANSTPFVTFGRGSIDLPGLFVNTGPTSNGGTSDPYKGRIIILVNESTQSSAEYQTMAFQSIPGTLTIGSTTAGADGNVSEIVLPGGLGTMISGINVLYPDGTETQRKGVKIDRIVQPSVEGVKEGRDEVLEAALGVIGGR